MITALRHSRDFHGGEHAARLMYAYHHRRTNTIFIVVVVVVVVVLVVVASCASGGCLCLTGGGVYVFTFNHVLRRTRESIGAAG